MTSTIFDNPTPNDLNALEKIDPIKNNILQEFFSSNVTQEIPTSIQSSIKSGELLIWKNVKQNGLL